MVGVWNYDYTSTHVYELVKVLMSRCAMQEGYTYAQLYTLYNIEDTIEYQAHLNSPWYNSSDPGSSSRNLTETPDSHLVLALLSATWTYHPTWTEAEAAVSRFPYSTLEVIPRLSGQPCLSCRFRCCWWFCCFDSYFVVSMTRYIKVWRDMW